MCAPETRPNSKRLLPGFDESGTGRLKSPCQLRRQRRPPEKGKAGSHYEFHESCGEGNGRVRGVLTSVGEMGRSKQRPYPRAKSQTSIPTAPA